MGHFVFSNFFTTANLSSQNQPTKNWKVCKSIFQRTKNTARRIQLRGYCKFVAMWYNLPLCTNIANFSWSSLQVGTHCLYFEILFKTTTSIFISFPNVMPGVPMATTPGFLKQQEYNQHNQSQQCKQTDQCKLRLLVKWWSQGCQVGATAQKGENNLHKLKMLKHRQCVSASRYHQSN